MGNSYILGIDQSTQGTKALLFDEKGRILFRRDKAHRQIVNEKGWVSHDPEEIWKNTLVITEDLLTKAGIDRSAVVGVGISNQRETSLAWDHATGEPLGEAIVWQCARATEIAERVIKAGNGEMIRERTGIPASAYFPAAKIGWILENNPKAASKARAHEICHGTIDSWMIYKLTGGKSYKTDYSNASRTQLFNILELKWDEEICGLFGIDPRNMAEVCDSDSDFGETDFEGILPHKVPIRGVLGDSHGALFGQGCLTPGSIKATNGTGSSIMMNIGSRPVMSTHGLVTSLAWGMGGKVEYVLEGNLNYTGAAITWLKDDIKMIEKASETQVYAEMAAKEDEVYMIPAFSGLGAPYWQSRAKAAIVGMTRASGKAEIVRAVLDSIAYQITDIVKAMGEDCGIGVEALKVDGGPTRNTYLMQFLSDIANVEVLVPDAEELSGIGPAYAAGIALGLWDKKVFDNLKRTSYKPQMDEKLRERKYNGWKNAVNMVIR